MQWIRTYLISIENDPNKPDYPVPDMDKNKKKKLQENKQKSSKLSMVTSSTFTCTSMKNNKVKRGM